MSVGTLPAEAADLSAEQRAALELRRTRESSRQEREQELHRRSRRESPLAGTLMTACNLSFTILLLMRLEGRQDIEWSMIMVPLWILDAVYILQKLANVYRHALVSPLSEMQVAAPELCAALEQLGVAITKVFIVHRLVGSSAAPTLVIFTPLWVARLLSLMVRCATPPPSLRPGRNRYILPGLDAFFKVRGARETPDPAQATHNTQP
jgi:hypothetical protein